jgi:hypothetical protein
MSDDTDTPYRRIEPGLFPESWHCIDCGVNTAPGLLNRAEAERAFAAKEAAGALAIEEGVSVQINDRSEAYFVRPSVWKAAGMEVLGGCLCIGCLEKRLGRRLRPKDFPRKHNFNSELGTPRLMERRGQIAPEEDAA